MKIQKENIIVIGSLILSIAISSFVWNFIKLPYNDINIVGVYAENEYNAFNEILRYLFFIFFPLITFIVLQIHYSKFKFVNHK